MGIWSRAISFTNGPVTAAKTIYELIWGGVAYTIASAVLSAVAHAVEPISRYGWGASVLAGLVLACAAALALSVVLVAWRYFRPLAPQTVDGVVAPTAIFSEDQASSPVVATPVALDEREIEALHNKARALDRTIFFLIAATKEHILLGWIDASLSETPLDLMEKPSDDESAPSALVPGNKGAVEDWLRDRTNRLSRFNDAILERFSATRIAVDLRHAAEHGKQVMNSELRGGQDLPTPRTVNPHLFADYRVAQGVCLSLHNRLMREKQDVPSRTRELWQRIDEWERHFSGNN